MSRSRNPSPPSGSSENFQSVDDFTAELSLDPDHELIVSEIGGADVSIRHAKVHLVIIPHA